MPNGPNGANIQIQNLNSLIQSNQYYVESFDGKNQNYRDLAPADNGKIFRTFQERNF